MFKKVLGGKKGGPGSAGGDGDGKHGNADHEQSLASVLGADEHRAALLILVADCMARMRARIDDNFDPNKADPVPKLPPRPTDSDALADAAVPTPEQLAADEAAAAETAARELETRRRELAAPAMLGLKQAALAYFDEWHDRVLERVGEAVNQREDEADTPVKTPKTTQPESGPAPPAPTAQSAITAVHKEDDDARLDAAAVADLQALYPPHPTPLTSLGTAERALIVHSLLLLLLGLEKYPAESRVLLLHVTSALGLPLAVLVGDEAKVAQGLLHAAQQQMSAEAERQKAEDSSVVSRRWKVGIGATVGAVLIGVTGGLAAPLLAAGLGTVMGGLGLGTTAAAAYLGALAGSAPLIGVLFGAYGGKMTGSMVDSYAKEVQDFAFVPGSETKGRVLFRAGADDENVRRLRVAIGVSGWLAEAGDVSTPWHVLAGDGTEPFALRWELDALLALGNALTAYIKTAAWSVAKREIISRTIFGALSAGLWPLGLAKMARVIDNPFSVAKSRADKAGAVLADALINKVQGERPVTLVGYSLGARLIYGCLQALAERRAFGLVENVVLLGAPAPSDGVAWRRVRSVVGGRLVNVYSSNDYLLGFLYRTSSLQYGIAGLQAVAGVVGVENVDVSELVDGHLQYRLLTGTILKQIGLEDVDVAEAGRQLEAEKEEEEEEKEDKVPGKDKDKDDLDLETVEALEGAVEQRNRAAKSSGNWLTSRVANFKIGSGGGEAGSKQKEMDKQAA